MNNYSGRFCQLSQYLTEQAGKNKNPWNTQDLNYRIKKHGLMDIDRILYLPSTEHIFFSSTHGHTLNHSQILKIWNN